MYNYEHLKKMLSGGEFDDKLTYIYASNDAKKYSDRLLSLLDGYCEYFGAPSELALFSAPGRTEIGGNHTDHQHGCVLAASVNLDVIAAVSLNGTDTVNIKSEGYPMDSISLNELEVNKAEYNCASALIRGVISKFVQMGYTVQGFNAYTTSNVLKGSGLSSSAAFEVLVGTVINGLFANGEVSAVEIAKIGKYAENVYFGKPSGLMDQMASSVGSIVAIDFESTESPVVEKVEFDFTKTGHSLCIIDSGADHADLTDEYASIPFEMKKAAAYFGKEYLREVDYNNFMSTIPELRKSGISDRAVLRAIHFFNDNKRAQDEVSLLKENRFDEFLKTVKKSGYSSYMYLQNVYASSMPHNQAVSLTLAMCDKILGERGAYRVHGGGFAGTVQAFVPNDMLEGFKNEIESVIGKDMCHILSIRPVGGVEL